LEQKLEATLGLEDRAVTGELNYLSAYQCRRLLEWWSLAEALSLKFVSQSGSGYFTNSYCAPQVWLDTYCQLWGNKFVVYTRLRAYNKEPDGDSRLTETDTPLVKQPTAEELKALLILSHQEMQLKGILKIGADCNGIYYEQLGIETNLAYLKFLFELLRQLIEANAKILAWGVSAIPALHEMGELEFEYLERLRLQLLVAIQNETKERLSGQPSQWWCCDCRVRQVGQIKLQIDSSLYYYYGCQVCGQSQNFFGGRVVAVLDQQMEVNQVVQDKLIQINWLKYRTMFDFDEVQVLRADDEAVERLAIQIGNDTDPNRKAQLQTITCKVAPDCQLSENTWKILKRTFRQVEKIQS
jgi:hypothetical protein